MTTVTESWRIAGGGRGEQQSHPAPPLSPSSLLQHRQRHLGVGRHLWQHGVPARSLIFLHLASCSVVS